MNQSDPPIGEVLGRRGVLVGAAAAGLAAALSADSLMSIGPDQQSMGPAKLDPIMSAVAANQDSTFAGQLSATTVQPTPRGIFIDVTKHGADPLGVADSTAAIQAAFDAAAGVTLTPGLGGEGLDAFGCTVFFPAGHYKTSAPLDIPSNVVIRGAGMRAARLFNNASALFAWDGDRRHVVFEHIYLSTGTSGGHLFDMGLSGGFALGRFDKVSMYTRNGTASMWKQHGKGRSFIDVRLTGCELDRADGTVPAWDISMSGNNANNITFADTWVHGHNTTKAPFFRIESTDAWNYAITFRDLTGEQNGGGLIHVLNAIGVSIDNCPDWDFAGVYQGSVYLFGGAVGCRGVKVKHSRRIKGGTLAPGVYDIDASSPRNRNITIEDCDFWDGTRGVFNLTAHTTLIGLAGTASPEGEVSAPPGAVYTRTTGGDGMPLQYLKRTGMGSTGWVPHGAMVQSYVRTTANYTITSADELVVGNGDTLTISLPAGGTMGTNRKVTIKNINATALTITTSPGLIDGASTLPLAQWESKTFVTDGSNSWLSI